MRFESSLLTPEAVKAQVEAAHNHHITVNPIMREAFLKAYDDKEAKNGSKKEDS